MMTNQTDFLVLVMALMVLTLVMAPPSDFWVLVMALMALVLSHCFLSHCFAQVQGLPCRLHSLA